jgi:hypothetical protein
MASLSAMIRGVSRRIMSINDGTCTVGLRRLAQPPEGGEPNTTLAPRRTKSQWPSGTASAGLHHGDKIVPAWQRGHGPVDQTVMLRFCRSSECERSTKKAAAPEGAAAVGTIWWAASTAGPSTRRYRRSPPVQSVCVTRPPPLVEGIPAVVITARSPPGCFLPSRHRGTTP